MGRHKIGFALVTYRDVEQAFDLIELLNRMLDNPPISMHHDFRQSSLDRTRLSSNVQQIPEAFKTGWGTMETVLAMTKSIEHLMSRSDAPDWFYLITGHCYPIKTATQMIKSLEGASYDLYLKQSIVYPAENPRPWDLEMQSRYVAPLLRVPFITRKRKIMYKYKALPINPAKQPFSDSFPCRSGATYFTGNRKAAEALAKGMADNNLIRWFDKRPIIDEALTQTILGNEPELRISKTDLRFVKWLDPSIYPDEPNPKTLRMEDFDEIAQSDMHIARKLLPGKSDELRRRIRKEILGLE